VRNFKQGEPRTLKILQNFKQSKNVNDFYTSLKNNDLLSTNKAYKAYMNKVKKGQNSATKENVTPVKNGDRS
jgi:hypothetical protein